MRVCHILKTCHRWSNIESVESEQRVLSAKVNVFLFLSLSLTQQINAEILAPLVLLPPPRSPRGDTSLDVSGMVGV